MLKPKSFRKQCGALALPGKRPGCVCIVGIVDTMDIFLLGEFESWDCRELVQKCFHLNDTYEPQRWVGDENHGSLRGILTELNRSRDRGRTINPVTPEVILDKYEQPYLYLLPEIKRMRDSERRLLHLDDGSAVLRYMAEILPDEIADLKMGAFPVLEAMAFAIIEVVRIAKAGQYDYNEKRDQGVQTNDLLNVN